MEGQSYQFTGRDLARLVAWPVGWLVLLAALIHASSGLGLLPPPLPLFDVDRTILLHQAAASRERSGATTLLVGDSSCLMNVAAVELQEMLGPDERVVNLGTLSYLDLEAMGLLVSNYARASPGTLRRVVLLMHPEALRLGHPEAYFGEILRRAWSGEQRRMAGTPPLVWWSGGQALRARVISRSVPSALPGAWGQFYGFSRELGEHLEANRGSAVDPREYQRGESSGSAEYRLAGGLEEASRHFRRFVPEGVELVAGITPGPEGFVLPNHAEVCEQMLRTWSDWLEADAMLQGLPCSLRDDWFASTTHLNEAGRLIYTRMLARELSDLQIPAENGQR